MASRQPQQPVSYKFQRLREMIRAAIVSGELSGKLPGERELGRRYQVNAKTIGKALGDLMSEGLLIRQVGRGTFVRNELSSSPGGRREREYRWVVDAHSNHTDHAAVFTAAEACAAGAGHQLTLDRLAPVAAGELPARWLSPSALRRIDGVVVFNSRASADCLADLKRRHIPVVMVDASLIPFKSHAVRPDYARGAFELAEYLIALGHRCIALVLPAGVAPSTTDAVRGWQAALARHQLPTPPVRQCHRQVIAELLSIAPAPSAIIAAGSHVAEDLRRWLASTTPPGGQKPALAVLMQPGQRLAADDVVASYRFDARQIVEWSLRLLEEASPGEFPREVVIPGVLAPADQPLADTPLSEGIPRQAVF